MMKTVQGNLKVNHHRHPHLQHAAGKALLLVQVILRAFLGGYQATLVGGAR
jgi:hypothetical protein